MINQITMLLSGVFSLLAIINILLPDYYNYIVRMSRAIPEKKNWDMLYQALMVLEVMYILLGYTSSVPLLFLALTAYEVIFAITVDISKYTTFIIYEFVFLVLNLTIFLWLFLS